MNHLNLEKGEVDIEGVIDALSYSQIPVSVKKTEGLCEAVYETYEE